MSGRVWLLFKDSPPSFCSWFRRQLRVKELNRICFMNVIVLFCSVSHVTEGRKKTGDQDWTLLVLRLYSLFLLYLFTSLRELGLCGRLKIIESSSLRNQTTPTWGQKPDSFFFFFSSSTGTRSSVQLLSLSSTVRTFSPTVTMTTWNVWGQTWGGGVDFSPTSCACVMFLCECMLCRTGLTPLLRTSPAGSRTVCGSTQTCTETRTS